MSEHEIVEMIDQGVELWGEDSQIEMLLEESIELALATRKYLREKPKGRPDKLETRYHDLAAEIADVEIMIKQVKRIHLGLESLVDEYTNMKWMRLKGRVEDGMQ